MTQAQATPLSSGLRAAALVPGLPQLLKPEWNSGYGALAGAMTALGDRLAAAGVERIVYYSTQWISVLGHSFQARPLLAGVHVDENWHDVVDMPFAFRIDASLAKRMSADADRAGYQTKLIDYEGFPVDTGTIVADQLLNKGRFRTSMVSCCVYSDYADTTRLAGVLTEGAQADGIPTAIVAVSGLSGRFFTTEIDPREDHVAAPADDVWNKRMIGLLEAGRGGEAEALIPEYAAACKVDMGFKALAFLKGVGALGSGRKAVCRAYAGIYGTGAAVLDF